MKRELEEKLVTAFPLLYSDRTAPLQKTCMCWGFSCGDGWFDLIWELSEKLEPLIQKWVEENPNEEQWKLPRAVQVKEKFGALRFYMSTETPGMSEAITTAEGKSATICEECGNPGVRRFGGWIRTLCDHHEEEYNQRRGPVGKETE